MSNIVSEKKVAILLHPCVFKMAFPLIEGMDESFVAEEKIAEFKEELYAYVNEMFFDKLKLKYRAMCKEQIEACSDESDEESEDDDDDEPT